MARRLMTVPGIGPLERDEFAWNRDVPANAFEPWRDKAIAGSVLTDPALIATAIAVLAPPPETFRKARDFAAWLGLVPRQHATGGKQRLGATTKMGERSLRRLLIIGARSSLAQPS